MTECRKKARNFIRNNKGFSLVEMIIVIAVVGILAGASLTMMGHIHYANIETVLELINTELSKQQIQAMSKMDKPYTYIYEYNDVYYIRTINSDLSSFDSSVLNADGIKLCNASTNIYMSKDGSAEELVQNDTFIKIVYNRAGSYSDVCNADNIRIAGSSSHTIKLIDETGKHVVD